MAEGSVGQRFLCLLCLTLASSHFVLRPVLSVRIPSGQLWTEVGRDGAGTEASTRGRISKEVLGPFSLALGRGDGKTTGK